MGVHQNSYNYNVIGLLFHALAKDQQYQEKSITLTEYQGREGWTILQLQQAVMELTTTTTTVSLDNLLGLGLPRYSSSQGAEVTNRPVQNSKTACVILICFFQQKGVRAVWLSSSRVTQICCLISEKPIVRIWQKLVKKSKKLSGTWKQRGCHNFYRRGVVSLHRMVLTKPFIIALTLIHKLHVQDIFTFVLVIAILCWFNPFCSNYG